jgi:hypothetical protein
VYDLLETMSTKVVENPPHHPNIKVLESTLSGCFLSGRFNRRVLNLFTQTIPTKDLSALSPDFIRKCVEITALAENSGLEINQRLVSAIYQLLTDSAKIFNRNNQSDLTKSAALGLVTEFVGKVLASKFPQHFATITAESIKICNIFNRQAHSSRQIARARAVLNFIASSLDTSPKGPISPKAIVIDKIRKVA